MLLVQRSRHQVACLLGPVDFYRRLQERLDLSFVRDLVADFYAATGRPSVDHEVFK